MANFYANYPITGSGGGSAVVTFYANFAAFPVSAPDGTLAVDLSTNTLYAYNVALAMWIPLGSSSAQYHVNVFTLSPTDITNKFVTLTLAPGVATDTILTVSNGPMQLYGTDFTVTGTTLSWSGLFLDGVLVSGDILIVQFN